jgi:hypothetical protein
MMMDEDKKLAFVSFCVEEYKTKLGAEGGKVMAFFAQNGVLDYLLENYTVLHSFGAERLVAEIERFLQNRNQAL